MVSAAITIAVDAMGGDHGPAVTLPAVIAALSQHPHLSIILVGDEAVLRQALTSYAYPADRLLLQHASQSVAMDESPALALRTKKDSSMRVAIDLVKSGKADACVSAGNTGALMMTARFVLKMLPGIDRPAIISSFPTLLPHKKVRILDLGANVDCTAAHLVQFAIMGSILASAVDQIEQPKVYLLNIGEEDIKGNELVKEAASALLATNVIYYAGYIEGDALYQGKADIIVCDGFVGNVTLKTTEGVSRFITTLMKEAFHQTSWAKLLGLLVKPVLKTFLKRVNPAEYNGATFLGLNGTVVKSHGGTTIFGFQRAIEEAMLCARERIPERIRVQVEERLSHSSTQQDTQQE